MGSKLVVTNGAVKIFELYSKIPNKVFRHNACFYHQYNLSDNYHHIPLGKNLLKSKVLPQPSVLYSIITKRHKSGEDNLEKTEVSKTSKLKKTIAEYGTTVLVFHIALSLSSLGICYLLVSSGVDVVKLLSVIGFTSDGKLGDLASNAGTFVIAYAVHKVFAPVRITITITSVPFIVRYLRKVGILKLNKNKSATGK